MRRLGPILATAVVAAALASCGKSSTEQAPGEAPAGSGQAAAPELTDEQAQKVLATLPAPYNTADLANGKAKFALCRSCHTITPGGANMTGPNLHGVFGRKAAQVEGFRYSDALQNADIVWDGPHLDEWLAKPMTYLPGTKMSFAGLKDAKDRTDLIAFLMVETRGTAQ
ncbi:cytochrome c family protein [Phenylobacterium zucineum HLK1]|uniref:Cytochrome c family protein n=1 Tax=Phenylobacterium zucineum (strain HLK1) TaxID=450851 RepID=B4R8H5_PHEZH|nr:cytochrome c family protein [Phenylobacterium zucineum]ACG77602.1 cytochrome c family protein [Phenylobacterium zucineum HLK1]